jgi:hypothetical protein
MPITLPVLGAFAIGLALRSRLERHFALVLRLNNAAGLAVLAFLAGWSFHASVSAVAGLALLLAGQLGAVGLGARLFRRHADAPLMSFALYGNPGFWSVPVAATVLGPRAAVVLATYDMLTFPRVAPGIRALRARAPAPQRARTALVDYAPSAAAMAGLAVGRWLPAPPVVPQLVVALATALAAVGAVLLGAAWPRGRGWLDARQRALVARILAVHLTFLPVLLLAAAVAGLAVPDAAWILALGPVPVSTLLFARLYGYSQRLAACALAISMAVAVALLPLAAWAAERT